jgi:hypothetical protein
MRSNLVIDYHQLGLTYKLYASDIHFNRGLCFAALGQPDACMADFDDAEKTKPLDSKVDYSRIDEGLELGEKAATYCKPFEISSNCIFRPPAGKLKNTDRIDYLGKSKVIASSKKNDGFSGFSGTQLKVF